MHYGLRILAATAALALAAAPAHAAVTISSAATQNMSCANGVCAPTATVATLNVGDLENLLASSNATVTTTGAGVQADDISIKVALSWSTTNALTLDAFDSITIEQPVSVTGQSALTLATNDGGTNGLLAFGGKGNVTFADLSSQLTIDGSAYTLVGDIEGLAAAIASNPHGDFALANSYDASGDGTYTSPPVSTWLTGTFDGLGHTISNLTIDDPSDIDVGLFAVVEGMHSDKGTVRDIGLLNANVTAAASEAQVGALVGVNLGGRILASYSTGAVTGAGTVVFVGGIAGSSGGNTKFGHAEIWRSYSTAVVTGGYYAFAGGLVGYSSGYSTIRQSFATGAVTGSTDSFVGGLAGYAGNRIENCYANGSAVTGDWDNQTDPAPAAGGLIAYAFLATVEKSYSIGRPSGGSGSYVGGFVGLPSQSKFNNSYWDTTTSGLENGTGGGNTTGLTGLTTAQFQSGLPKGLHQSIWSENPNINGGLPYLLANPPPK